MIIFFYIFYIKIFHFAPSLSGYCVKPKTGSIFFVWSWPNLKTTHELNKKIHGVYFLYDKSCWRLSPSDKQFSFSIEKKFLSTYFLMWSTLNNPTSKEKVTVIKKLKRRKEKCFLHSGEYLRDRKTWPKIMKILWNTSVKY